MTKTKNHPKQQPKQQPKKPAPSKQPQKKAASKKEPKVLARQQISLEELERVMKGESIAEIRGLVVPEPIKAEREPEPVIVDDTPEEKEVHAPADFKNEVDPEQHVQKLNITLTPNQDAVVQQIKSWYLSTPGYGKFELEGHPGTGKSTVIKYILQELPVYRDAVRLCAYTGTASLVLEEKTPGYATSTLHRLFYAPTEVGNGRVMFLPSKDNLNNVSLVIIDEAFMVGEKIGTEVLEMAEQAGCKVLVVGDSDQLSPVKDNAYFFLKPDARLTEIMRQAAGNPILQLAADIRQATRDGHRYEFPRNEVWNRDSKLFMVPRAKVSNATLAKVIQNGGAIISARNETRKGLNRGLREELNFTEHTLMEGETVVIKENIIDRENIPVTNGMRGKATDVHIKSNGLIGFTFTPDKFSGSRELEVHPDVLFELTTTYELNQKNRENMMTGGPLTEVGNDVRFGYVITGHQSQGSEWPVVYMIDESWSVGGKSDPKRYVEQNRWLHTVVTRAAEKLVIMV